MFYPRKYFSESLNEAPDYHYIHAEVKKLSVNLKLLWREYKDHCRGTGDLFMGYTKFCEGYSEHVALWAVRNSITLGDALIQYKCRSKSEPVMLSVRNNQIRD